MSTPPPDPWKPTGWRKFGWECVQFILALIGMIAALKYFGYL